MTSAVAVASFTSLSCAWSLLPCQSARSARGASNVKSYGSSDGKGSGGSVVLVGTAVAARSWCRWRHRRHSATRAAPLELASDFDAEDPELRVEAAHSVGAFSLTSTLWPPKKLLTNTAQLSPIKAETSVGRYTGSAPVFAEWPFYEIEIANVSCLEDSAEELQRYRVVNFEQGLLTRAFVLTSRWQKVNLGRSAGFQLLGMGLLSGFKSTNPILMRELQGLNILQGYLAEKSESESPPTSLQSEEEFDEFMKEMEASDFITEEFRAVAPVQRDVYVTGLVSSAGSSLSIWTWKPGDDYIEVHFCLGHDCLAEGPLAEERLMRLLAGRAAALGAHSLRCRARFTEKGKLLVPCKSLGFKLVPGESEFPEDMSDEDAMSNLDSNFTKPKDYRFLPEAVPGLRTWLLLLCLEEKIDVANEWCNEMGAATLEEVIESREELADFLEENSTLTPGEREALLERDR